MIRRRPILTAQAETGPRWNWCLALALVAATILVLHRMHPRIEIQLRLAPEPSGLNLFDHTILCDDPIIASQVVEVVCDIHLAHRGANIFWTTTAIAWLGEIPVPPGSSRYATAMELAIELVWDYTKCEGVSSVIIIDVVDQELAVVDGVPCLYN